jgi:hypothetical protein
MWRDLMPRREAVLRKELRTIPTLFRLLARSFSRIAPILTAAPELSTGADGEGRPRNRPRMSRAYRAAPKLQDKYMGTMRGLPPRNISQVKRIRAEKGSRAALRAAERMAG